MLECWTNFGVDASSRHGADRKSHCFEWNYFWVELFSPHSFFVFVFVFLSFFLFFFFYFTNLVLLFVIFLLVLLLLCLVVCFIKKKRKMNSSMTQKTER